MSARFCLINISVAVVLAYFGLSGTSFAQEKKEVEKPQTRTFTAPPPGYYAKKKEAEKPKVTEPEKTTYSLLNARFELMRVEKGNPGNLPPGYYATYTPPVPDTIQIFEGGSDVYQTIQANAGREIISSRDSVTIMAEVAERQYRLAHLNDASVVVTQRGKTNSTVTRTGFVPGQGFGTNRYRFAIKPGNFRVRKGALVTASVHSKKAENNIGTIICGVTSVDAEHNTFTIETSNEVPLGEDINWIIINYPETF